jgi:hypothetical protein
MKFFFRSIPGLLLALGLVLPLRAQQPAAETLDQNLSLPQAHENVPPSQIFDQDLGEIGPVQTYPKPPMFTASVSQQVFYTDNVFYTDGNTVGSAAYLGSYTVDFVPYSTRDWTPQIALQYNMVRYDRAAAGDFDNENLALSSAYVFSKDRTWTWTAAVDLSRFTTPHHDDSEFYKEVVYDNQIQKVIPLIKDTLYFIGAYGLTYHEAKPADFDRLDNSLSFSLLYYPVPELSLSPFVRPAAWLFPTDTSYQHDRRDFNLSEGLEVTWKPWKYLDLSADIVETDDYSTAAGQSYATTIPGFSLTGTISF